MRTPAAAGRARRASSSWSVSIEGAVSARTGSEEWIHSSIALSSPSTHLRSVSVESLVGIATRGRRGRSTRRTVPTHFWTIWSFSTVRSTLVVAGAGRRIRSTSLVATPRSSRAVCESSRTAWTDVYPAWMRVSAVSVPTPSALASSADSGDLEPPLGATMPSAELSFMTDGGTY